MSNRKKAAIAIAGFTVGNIVSAAALAVAARYGMAHDLIAMIGLGVLFISGLFTIAYVLFQAVTDVS